MIALLTRLSVASWIIIAPTAGLAQTADEVIEKSIAALGGREAHAKLKSRAMAGTITLSTPAGDIKGSIEILSAPPNKQRTLIKADLSALGAGALVVDQRFDGSTGYVMDSLQGNRDITGNQLDNMRNSSFPHPFLNYQDLGISAKLKGKEKVGDRDVYVLVFEPTSGSTVTQYIDAESYLPVGFVTTVNVPQLGQDVEQTTEFKDFRDLDGVKIPYRIEASSAIQSFTVVVDKVEHNTAIDPALFAKPVAQ